MRRNGDLYEYVAVYVNDLAIAMKHLKDFVDILENVHRFKTKGTAFTWLWSSRVTTTKRYDFLQPSTSKSLSRIKNGGLGRSQERATHLP
jgi:hypothetical protein